MSFTTNAENHALKCGELSNFKQFNLIGFKEKIRQILSLIGKNSNGIFLTYTKHDISHIEAMLQMCSWLIPEKTKEKMTNVDWLLIVLACYLHDLGLIVTDQEFNNRKLNSEYIEFKNWLENDSSASDYRDRITLSKKADREKFYFQEYVRRTHASRIKEWIIGRNLEKWEKNIGKLASIISKDLNQLPPRFVNDLAIVCESHHLNDLDDDVKYKLYQTYGNSQEESANVQYAAIILRTLDLIHITKDRTPSIEYVSLNITDPIGIQEWEKQLGTYAVLPASRDLDEKDPDTFVIGVTADFIDERPFFSLSEYLAYADNQIKQSKKWIEQSIQKINGKNYLFPWHAILANIKVEGNDPIPLKFELDRGKLLDLLVGHTIYNDPTVVIRELMQNSIDAIRYRIHQEGDKFISPQIDVIWNEKLRELTIQDNGIGMDREIITNHLMKVGSSFYTSSEFINQNVNFSPISKFGIGILTCFMVSDEVEIITKKYNNAYRVKMTSVHSNYLLKELTYNKDLNNIGNQGTIIRLKIRSSVDLIKRPVSEILKYWIVFPPCKVFYSESNSKKTEIGFDSIHDAFKYFHAPNNKQSTPKNLEIEHISKTIDNEIYEIAFATYNAYQGIPRFLNKSNSGPTICVEGIRVANSLPRLSNKISRSDMDEYYGSDKSIATIVLIKNNKKIRTTVSRDGLEVDSEYFKIGELIISFFFEFISTRINEMKNAHDGSLTRTSMAAQWLLDAVSNSLIGELAKKSIEEKHQFLPTIVIEEIENQLVSRSLVSKNDFLKNKCFWTIDSRLLQYLSVLSKDLGRELGFTNFIQKLAPDLLNPQITPLLIESTNYDAIIFGKYIPYHGYFSEKYQQISIKWEPNTNCKNILETIRSNINLNDLSTNLNSVLNVDFFEHYGGGDKYCLVLNNIFICNIKGDNENVKAIATSKFALINPNTDAADFWRKLMELIWLTLDNGDQDGFYILLSCANLFFDTCLSKIGLKTNSNASVVWHAALPKLLVIGTKYGFEFVGQEHISSIIGDAETWFSPSKYWFDKNRFR